MSLTVGFFGQIGLYWSIRRFRRSSWSLFALMLISRISLKQERLSWSVGKRERGRLEWFLSIWLNGSIVWSLYTEKCSTVRCPLVIQTIRSEKPTFGLTVLVVVDERNAQLFEFVERATGRTEFRVLTLAGFDHELGKFRIVIDVRLQMIDGCEMESGRALSCHVVNTCSSIRFRLNQSKFSQFDELSHLWSDAPSVWANRAAR